MPVAIIGAIASAAFTYAAAADITAITFFSLTGWEALFARAFISFAISELGTLLSKPKSSNPNNASAQQRTQQIVAPEAYSETVHGEVMKSGTIVYGSNTENNKFVHLVIIVADHLTGGAGETMVNSNIIPPDYLDADGNVTKGIYAGVLRIRFHNGESGQLADSFLVAEDPAWTAAHRLQGRSYFYVRYDRTSKVFGSAPNFAFLLRGKKIYDSRSMMVAWTPNIGLQAFDWMQDEILGAEVDVSNIDDPTTQASANSCEEMVETQPIVMNITAVDTTTGLMTVSDAAGDTVLQYQRGDAVQFTGGSIPTGFSAAVDYYVIPFQFMAVMDASGNVTQGPRLYLAASLQNALANDGVGIPIIPSTAGSGALQLTKTHEPRYFGGGVISSDTTLGDALGNILTGMAGRPTYSGGVFRLYAGVWRAPTATIDEDDMRGPLSVQTRTTWAQRFNTVIGSYTGPLNNWQSQPYPQVSNDTFVAADNGTVLQSQIDLPYTQRVSTAQRIATINLNLARQEIVVNAPCKLTALQFMALDTLYMDNTRFGWSGKIFEVSTWKLSFQSGSQSAPLPGVDMILQETASACYDWNSGQEEIVDPAPNTNLPNPFFVGQIEGLSVNSIAISTKGLDTVYRVIATWDAIQDGFVTSQGHIHFAYRLSGTTTWTRLPSIPGDAGQADIFSGELGQGYDLQVWLENSLGIIGTTYEINSLSVGSPGGVGTTIDWGSVANAVGPTNDWGLVTNAPTLPGTDWGGVA